MSIGIALFPVDATDSGTLALHADSAMYHSKEQGKNTASFFTPEINRRTKGRLDLENGIRVALEQQDFVLYYQPKVAIDTGRIVGVEALVRWQHPIRGLVPPDEFVPVAEECGLIVGLGNWVLRTACATARAWDAANLPQIGMAVNVSGRQFLRRSVVDDVKAALEATGFAADRLEIEVTEGVLMQHSDNSTEDLQALRDLGVQVSIDDFGTGYSSLSYLKRLPIDTLKIDKSFIQDVSDNSHDAAIASAIIDMARSLQLNVVAEGVETEAQVRFLQRKGCGLVQGYYFGQALPLEDMEELLRGGGILAPPSGD